MRNLGQRRSVRRSVAIECDVQSAYWDGVVSFLASDLSNEGIWLESKIALEPGDELAISFVPPSTTRRVWALAHVVRVGARAGEASGMGLAVSYMSEADRAVLVSSLAGLPPRLPGARVPPILPVQRRRSAPQPSISAMHGA